MTKVFFITFHFQLKSMVMFTTAYDAQECIGHVLNYL